MGGLGVVGGGYCPKQRGRAYFRVHGCQQYHVDGPGRAVFGLDRNLQFRRRHRGPRRLVSDGQFHRSHQMAFSRDGPLSGQLPGGVRFRQGPRCFRRRTAHQFQTEWQWRLSGVGHAGRRDHHFTIRAPISAPTGRCFVWTGFADGRAAFFQQSDSGLGQ